MSEKYLEQSGVKVLATELGLQLYMTESSDESGAAGESVETGIDKAFLELQSIPLYTSAR